MASTATAPSTSATALNTPSSTTTTQSPSREQTEARAAVLASLQAAGSNYDAQFQRRAADLHVNEKAISKQEAELKKQAAALAKESANWEKEINKASKGLKEIGDVQNWAEMLERDFLVVEETLRLAEGGMEIESESKGSTWR